MSLPHKKVRLQRQVLSALFVGGVGAFVYEGAVRAVLSARFGAFPQPTPPAWLSFAVFFGGFYGAAWWWARPLKLFLDEGREDLRPLAVSRYLGLYRFITGLWAANFALQSLAHAAWSGGGGAAAWASWTFYSAVYAYYGGYLSVVFLDPLLIRAVSGRLYAEPELYRRKEGPFWSIHIKLVAFVVNLVLLPLVLLELARESGVAGDTTAGVIIVTFVFAAGYIETLYHSIARPLGELNKKMERLAAGDFDCKTSVLDDDEIGELKAHFNSMVDGLAERERLKDTFGRYVSVEVAKKLMESGAVSLGGESISATILFSDIRGFTTLSERMSPEELVRFLNSYFSFVTEPIMAHRGMVNKFIGDAVMAVFAPQFGSKDHADDAVRAALGMRERLAAFNAEGLGPGEVGFGVGVHTGLLVAGNIGTEKRLEFTVIGDTVNIAARIESMNKDLGSVILVSEQVHAALSPALRDGLKAELCEAVRLKGKEKPIGLYKLL
ncbi:MAG: adenylate/guanylate cyclase domain-containing protein [Elusimicrobiota bacterium]|nr:adenylate/guanylate cyclase domain-containing protein [Elusimicrobiota bacterium]